MEGTRILDERRKGMQTAPSPGAPRPPSPAPPPMPQPAARSAAGRPLPRFLRTRQRGVPHPHRDGRRLRKELTDAQVHVRRAAVPHGHRRGDAPDPAVRERGREPRRPVHGQRRTKCAVSASSASSSRGSPPDQVVRNIKIPLNKPSLFLTVIENRRSYLGPLESNESNNYLVNELGGAHARYGDGHSAGR